MSLITRAADTLSMHVATHYPYSFNTITSVPTAVGESAESKSSIPLTFAIVGAVIAGVGYLGITHDSHCKAKPEDCAKDKIPGATRDQVGKAIVCAIGGFISGGL